MKLLVTFIFLFGCLLSPVICKKCEIITSQSGTIYEDVNVLYGGYGSDDTCWMLPILAGKFIRLKINEITEILPKCADALVKISVAGTTEEYSFGANHNYKHLITALNNVTVTHYAHHSYCPSYFNLIYKIQDIECINADSFHCDNYTCIPRSKVCNGFEDCKNGADEVGCETGISSIKGVVEARNNAISWLKKQRSASWGWNDYTSRAVVALYLASDANFNGKIFEEELMAKQTELKTAVALLKSSITNNDLSMFINGLLVTCHNPRKFYALCNAHESWPHKAISDVNYVLNISSDYLFVEDLQAMAVMAVSCSLNNSESVGKLNSSTTLTLYHHTIDRFKKLIQNGHFGNVYTTALLTQALLSSGQEHSKDWNLNATINYLMNSLNSPSIDFLSTYLILPILNGKSLIDVSKVNCSANPRKHGDDPVLEISEHLGSKMRVQYSLYIGDEKDVIHTIFLRVPENYTAAEVMERAEVEDPKYKFKWKTISDKMYVYDIANVINDPEVGKFWLLYR
ncbi:uncharacterized protein CG3556 [Caerostris darwini]|uniref:Uncharacterized protein CG3556 n=1 Tax=Caerostris darwini TaxID=1538125 RepID=A0AAV4M3X9_9ARAC|nr:uncharacterized protein CG3556 [Caerostris darwini]